MEKHKLNSTMRLEKGRRKRTGRRVEEGDRDNGEGEIMEDKYSISRKARRTRIRRLAKERRLMSERLDEERRKCREIGEGVKNMDRNIRERGQGDRRQGDCGKRQESLVYIYRKMRE